MPPSTPTSRGLVTVPTVQLRPVAGSARKLLGLLQRDGIPPLSISEMDQAIAGFVADEDERIRAGETMILS